MSTLAALPVRIGVAAGAMPTAATAASAVRVSAHTVGRPEPRHAPHSPRAPPRMAAGAFSASFPLDEEPTPSFVLMDITGSKVRGTAGVTDVTGSDVRVTAGVTDAMGSKVRGTAGVTDATGPDVAARVTARVTDGVTSGQANTGFARQAWSMFPGSPMQASAPTKRARRPRLACERGVVDASPRVPWRR